MRILLIIMAVCALMCSCGGGECTAVPRPKAFPRMSLYPAEYVSDTVNGMPLSVNSSALIERPADNQLTLSYPAYGLKVYVTVLHPEAGQMERLVAGRMQRMELDMGSDLTVETAENDRYYRSLGMARSEITPTPYEFMVCAPGPTLVWGAAAWLGVPENADSVAPAAQAVLADIRRMINDIE